MICVKILAEKHHVENPRFKYTLSFLNAHPLISNQLTFSISPSGTADLVIYYGRDPASNQYHIPAQNVFFNLQKSAIIKPVSNQYLFEDQKLSSVELKRTSSGSILVGKEFQFDLFETIFFHISRYEEVFAEPTQNSEAGWLQEDLHFLIRHQLQYDPVIDNIVEALLTVLLGRRLRNTTTYSISHDVDILKRFTPFPKFVRSLAASTFHARGIKHIIASIRHYRGMLKKVLKDPYDSFHFMLRSSSTWKSKTMYLMTGGTSKYDNRYEFSDPQVTRIIEEGLSKGYTIGFHPSYNAHIDNEMYELEKHLIDQKTGDNISANRQHWLRFSWNKTPNILASNGIRTDSSMGYNNHVGFRCGTGFPYKMYDFEKERSYDWIEQPLAFMDSSLIHFCNNTAQSPKEITELFFKKNQLNTHIGINFHNSNFDPTTDHGEELRTIYTKYILPTVER